MVIPVTEIGNAKAAATVILVALTAAPAKDNASGDNARVTALIGGLKVPPCLFWGDSPLPFSSSR